MAEIIGERNIKKVLEEAYKRLIPALGYLVSSKAGFIASVIVFTTWLIKNGRGRYKEFSIKEDEKVVVKLLKDIKEQKARIKLLEKTREHILGEDERKASMLDEIIMVEKDILENLYTELELRQLRLEALRRLTSLGDPKLLEAVREMVRKIERNEKFEEHQYKILKQLEEKWRRKEIEINTLKEVLRYA